MKRQYILYLRDVIRAIESIEKFIEGIDFENLVHMLPIVALKF